MTIKLRSTGVRVAEQSRSRRRRRDRSAPHPATRPGAPAQGPQGPAAARGATARADKRKTDIDSAHVRPDRLPSNLISKSFI